MTYAEQIYTVLAQTFPGAEILVEDPRNDGVHLSLQISHFDLDGLSRVRQHQLIYRALGHLFQEGMHALSIHIRSSSAFLSDPLTV
jgi:stress-induced morphogen